MISRFSFLLLFIFSCNTLSAQQDNEEVRNHLQLKVDVLSPVLSLLPSIKTYTLGTSVEYQIKSKFGIQLGGYYYWENNYKSSDRNGYLLIPEFRYYLSHHFLGAYFKSDTFKYPNALHEMSREMSYQNIGFGILYGYQKEVQRVVFEGRVGIGINQKTKNPIAYTISQDKMIDTIFAFNIGWKLL